MGFEPTRVTSSNYKPLALPLDHQEKTHFIISVQAICVFVWVQKSRQTGGTQSGPHRGRNRNRIFSLFTSNNKNGVKAGCILLNKLLKGYTFMKSNSLLYKLYRYKYHNVDYTPPYPLQPTHMNSKQIK